LGTIEVYEFMELLDCLDVVRVAGEIAGVWVGCGFGGGYCFGKPLI
jgi:hypothetical protein